MNYAEAVQILESEEFAIQQRGEILAEAGMSAVAMGFDGYDGMAVASMQMAADADPDAEREWAAKVAAAEAYLADCPRIVYVTPTNYGVRVFPPTLPVDRADDDIPF